MGGRGWRRARLWAVRSAWCVVPARSAPRAPNAGPLSTCRGQRPLRVPGTPCPLPQQLCFATGLGQDRHLQVGTPSSSKRVSERPPSQVSRSGWKPTGVGVLMAQVEGSPSLLRSLGTERADPGPAVRWPGPQGHLGRRGSQAAPGEEAASPGQEGSWQPHLWHPRGSRDQVSRGRTPRAGVPEPRARKLENIWGS